MAIYLRPDITSDLLEAAHGSLEDLIVAWEARAMADPKFPKPRQRSSMYRWLKDGVPSRGDQIMAYCAMLDVDPLAIFDYRRNGYFRNFATLRRNLQLGLEAAGVFSPLFKVYRPGPHWPSDEHVRPCYGRNWFGVVFDNKDQWSSSDYGLVKVKFSAPASGRPRACHIAYRRTPSPDTMWRYFGTVLSVGGQLELYSEGGAFQEMQVVEQDEIRFRTYFGGRPVEFRVASLHAFGLTTEFPHNDKKTIGFEW